jgi:transcriptional regulator with XRE-family HTH domain
MAKQRRLASFLREYRVKSGLSQADVAAALKYSTPQFISNWERGVSSPPLDKLSQLIEIYRISRDELIDIMLDEARDHLESNIPRKKMA